MADDLPARAPDLGSEHRTSKVAHAIIPRDVTAGGMTLSIGVQILEPTVLDSYARRKMISLRQYEAGTLLAQLFHRAIHLPSITAAWGEQRGGGGGHESGIDGRKILWGALLAAGLAIELRTEQVFTVRRRGSVERENVRGPVGLNELGDLAIAVCGYDDRAGGTERLNMFRQALDQLADMWSLPDHNNPRHEGRIRNQMQPDAKPVPNDGESDFSWSDRQNKRRANRSEHHSPSKPKPAKAKSQKN